VIRVAFDSTPLIGQRTGIGRLVDKALAGLSTRPAVAIRAFSVTWRGRAEFVATLPQGVTQLRIPMAAWPLHQAWLRFDGPVIEWWTGPVDVVHGTSFVVPPAARAAEVVSVHDLAFLRYPELCDPVTGRYHTLLRRALARGAHVHALSHTMAGEIVSELGADPARVHVISPGVDVEPPPPGPPTEGSPGAGHPPSGRPYVLAIGRAEPRKDLPTLVRAFDQIAAAHPDLDLVIAGPTGPGEAALEAAMARSSCRGRIRRVGWIDEDSRKALVRGAWVFAYPSLYEGFGLPPLEAMSAGVPVVATAAGAVPEVVAGAARLVPVADASALASALAEVATDTALRARLVAAGRARAATFTWDRYVDGLERLYREIATNR
jgi:glycosyltransferase involved in cell wall biosynthesis